MRKTIATIILMTALCGQFALAQNAKEIVDRHVKALNIVGYTSESAFFMDLKMKYRGLLSPNASIRIISQNYRKLNMRMNTMGVKMNVVINGDNGWVKMGNNVEELPQTDQKKFSESKEFGNMMDEIVWSDTDFTFEYEGEDKDNYIVRIIPIDKRNNKTTVGRFSKSSGLLTSYDTQENGSNATVILQNYKRFRSVTFPSEFKYIETGRHVMTMVVLNLIINYPVNAQTFAKPN